VEYLAAVKKPFENPDIYLTLSIMSWIPVANIYVAGYLLDFCAGRKFEGRKMVQRFVLGSQFVALLVVYLFLPILAWYLVRFSAGAIIALLELPPFSLSVYELARNNLDSALDMGVLKKAFSPEYLQALAKALVATFVSLVVHALIPVVGWVGILYGPSSTFMHVMGKEYSTEQSLKFNS